MSENADAFLMGKMIDFIFEDDGEYLIVLDENNNRAFYHRVKTKSEREKISNEWAASLIN